ncbi:phage integrase central domain-containing protein [Methylomicrobium album]|uniref:phage integrase central domain-containing protein n=1 Tax=Methylomicrobium album TaxID=39775 RepID=UPI003CCB0AA6
MAAVCISWLNPTVRHGDDSITGLLETIRRIESRGAIETAHRTDHTYAAVFAFATGTQRCENNPATAIRSVLKPVPLAKEFYTSKRSGQHIEFAQRHHRL